MDHALKDNVLMRHDMVVSARQIFYPLLFMGVFTLVLPAYAGDTAAGLQAIAANTGLSQVGSVNTAIGNVIGVALAFSGILFFGLSIYGGITWMTAAGNQENVKKGLKILLTAIAGLLVVLSAYAITSFVFENTGTTVTSASQTSP